MRATAPSGNADFEGLVAWSGELGYGIRVPEPSQAVADDDVEDFDQEPTTGSTH